MYHIVKVKEGFLSSALHILGWVILCCGRLPCALQSLHQRAFSAQDTPTTTSPDTAKPPLVGRTARVKPSQW